MKRIYLSGPMSGLPEHNFPAFNAESARIRALGYEVINPVDINPDAGTSWHECLRKDLSALLECDTLALLDGWERSNGAHLELHMAHRVGMNIVLARDLGRVTTFDLISHLHRQREFSVRTFGPGMRTAGVLDHIAKEMLEIQDEPADLSEWIDIVLLALDGAWRAGHSPEDIAAALAAKQNRNEARQWPDWRTADPNKAIEHRREAA
jgi:hypothetical protein